MNMQSPERSNSVLYTMGTKYLFVLVLSLLLPGIAHSGNGSYYFKQFSLREGLSQSNVTTIVEDRLGNYWFGTKNGLNRLSDDGIDNFYTDKTGKTFRTGNISLLKSDARGDLWTAAGITLYRYDFTNAVFEQLFFEGNPIITDTSLEHPAGIYFGSVGMVLFYDYKTREFKAVCDFRTEHPSLFLHLHARTPDGGLILTDYRYKAYITYPGPGAELMPLPELNKICAAIPEEDGAFWISRYNRGLSRVRFEGGRLIEEEHFTTRNSQLSNDTILDICRHNGILWLATDGGGINIFDPESRTFAPPLTHDEGFVSGSLPSNSITCLFNDSKNNIWAGSVWNGVINIREVYMHTFEETPNGLSCGTVSCLWRDDHNGKIWIGTDGGGLCRLDLDSKRIDRIPSTEHKKVITITEFSEHELLAYLYQEGMVRIDKRNGTLRPFTIVNPAFTDSLRKTDIVIELHRFNNGDIGMFGNIRHIYDASTGRFRELVPPQGIINPQLIPIGNDNDGNILLTCEQLVLRYTRHSPDPETVYVNRQKILAAAYDGSAIWIGDSDGLKHVDLQNGETTEIQKPFDMTITSIVCVKGSVWIGTNRGIFRYIPDSGKFAFYDEPDGAITNEYIRRAVLTSPEGDVFMGGVNGLLYISAEIPDYQEQAPLPMKVENIQIDGKRMIYNGEELKLPHDYSSFHLDLQILGADVIETKHMRYYLTEGDHVSLIESSQNAIDLSNLKPGHYTLKASYYMQAGTWSPQATIVRFQVRSPWWQQWWASLSLAIAILCMTGGIIYVLDRRRKRRLQIETAENNRRLAEEKVRFLVNISHELRTPLTLIYAPLKRFVEHPSAEEPMRRALAGALEQVLGMTQLANMVIDIRKMEVGNGQIEIERHHLKEWIEHMADSFRNEFMAKGMELVVACKTTVEYLNFDEMKCRIVLSNLLMNALKYSGGNTGSVTIEVSGPASGAICISVIDCGKGLEGGGKPERLFERFYQNDPHSKGAGIGLSYAKMLVDMHGGRIGAFNNPTGRGATFWFEIPTSLQCETHRCRQAPYFNELIGATADHSIRDAEAPDLTQYSIVIADDNAEMIELLRSACTPVFKAVYTANDGEQALELIRLKAPDIIVSDVMMPRMDGYELCRRVKSDLNISHIPIVLLTARTDKESSILGYKMGADVYVPKPFDTDFLLFVLANQIRNRIAVRQHWNAPGFRISPEKMTFSNADEMFLTKLNGIIAEHLSDASLNVNTLTNAMGVSRSVFYNKMKKLTDMGIMDYIAHIRIERAMEMIRTSQMNISEISAVLGFENASYFSTVFKRMTGQTPTQYRQSASPEEEPGEDA